jgi:hypothetical protein
MDKKYKIIKIYYPIRGYAPPTTNVRGKRGLTLEEAQAHCGREDTHKKGEWFHGFTEDK